VLVCIVQDWNHLQLYNLKFHLQTAVPNVLGIYLVYDCKISLRLTLTGQITAELHWLRLAFIHRVRTL